MTRTEPITVEGKEEAWKRAVAIFPFDYEEDPSGSKQAGYPIYKAVGKNQSYICDLNDRLELNIVHDDGKHYETVNIWIEDRRYTAAEVRSIITKNQLELAAVKKIREAAGELDTEIGKTILKMVDQAEKDAKAKLAVFGL